MNGLQTSTEVYHYFEEVNLENDDRKILVRVVVPVEAESRDRIIKATNSQTAVQQASLRATDKIHRDIEEYLRPRGLFYGRRKNYYKNEGKPRDKVVGISHLAQSVMSIVLQRPDTARGRPSSLLKKDTDYSRVYSEKLPIRLYYVCAEAMRRVVSFLIKAGLDSKDRNNLRFYVVMHSVVSLVGKSKPFPTELAQLDVAKLDDMTLKTSLELVEQEYAALGGNDQVAKGPWLLNAIQKPSKAIRPFIPTGLMHGFANPIKFAISGNEVNGFPATFLPEICRAVPEARPDGTLDHQQPALAARCEILVQRLAIVGIRGLWMRQQDISINPRDTCHPEHT